MPEDRIRYDILAQDALRGVMRKVLAEVARTGLPGEHHFFITFLTHAPGVRVSSRLRERYPEQMTIVLQYQYWDLKVTETGFEVGLSFADVPEMLHVPFSAVRGFYDPSVNFELEFDVKPEQAAPSAEITEVHPAEDEEATDKPAPRKKSTRKPKKEKSEAEAETPSEDEAPATENKGAEVVSLDAFRKK
ncbi:SspB family protein [Nitratireductor sp. GISD-1A_MAKvit]|uniref:SspB family protein n=1 Tax=Nitratireductor sp. GISD-1A_MAKvit TaxID=3234198 RepID=UPI003467875D